MRNRKAIKNVFTLFVEERVPVWMPIFTREMYAEPRLPFCMAVAKLLEDSRFWCA